MPHLFKEVRKETFLCCCTFDILYDVPTHPKQCKDVIDLHNIIIKDNIDSSTIYMKLLDFKILPQEILCDIDTSTFICNFIIQRHRYTTSTFTEISFTYFSDIMACYNVMRYTENDYIGFKFKLNTIK